MNSISANIFRLKQQIPEQVTLIAVSKTRTIEDVLAVYAAGIQHFGENYLQEAIPKVEALQMHTHKNSPLTWHYLGRLQTRKLKAIAQYFSVIHSLDRLDHATKLNAIAASLQKKLQVFVQVNLDEEPQKGGVLPQDLVEFIEKIQALSQLEVLGLMLIPQPARPELTLQKFKQLKQISLTLGSKTQGQLSMGMSSDYLLAIESGATHVRIGTAIFGERS